jgi:WD40 repeat protein
MVKLWSFDTHELLATLAGHNAAVSALAFSPDGTYLASAGDEPLIIMWDPKTAKQLYQLESHEDKVFALAFSPDGNFLASAGFSNLVIIWDPKTGSQLQKFKTKGGIAFDMAFSTDNKTIFVPSSSNIELHSIETGNLITDIGDSLGRVYSVLISTDGKTMISCGSEGIVRVFRVP